MLTTSCPHLCTSTLFMLWDGNEIKSLDISSMCKPQSKKLMESLLSVDDAVFVNSDYISKPFTSSIGCGQAANNDHKSCYFNSPSITGQTACFALSPRFELYPSFVSIYLTYSWCNDGCKGTEPPVECKSWTCILKYWSQPDDLLNGHVTGTVI